MNPISQAYSKIGKDFQKQIGDFGDRLFKESSPASASKRRGGLPGEQIPSGYRRGRISNFDDQQTELYNRGFEAVGPDSYLSRLSRGDEDLFNQIEAPDYRRFSALQGNLASRFSGAGGQGSLGARRSSGFYNSANDQASDFALQIASRRQDLQRQAIQDLRGLSNDLLGQRPYENFLAKKQYPQQQPDQSGDFLGGIFSGAAGAGAGYLTGGAGGAVAGGLQGFNSGYNRGR